MPTFSPINLNGTAPASPSGKQNISWQSDTASPANISAWDPTFIGDAGSGGKAGNVPAPAAGDATANKFLKADGTWTALGTAASQSSTAFDAAGAAASAQAASLQKSNNLSDLPSVSTAKTNLGLATVASSGSYNDLSSRPSIPAAQVNSDWNAVSGLAQILNKPTLGTAAAQNTGAFDAAGTAAALLASNNTWAGNQSFPSSLTFGWSIDWTATIVYGTPAYFTGDMRFPYSNGFWFATPNTSATTTSWYEFRIIASPGASAATDWISYQYNQRSTSGGSDAWRDVFQIAAQTGAVTYYTATNFQIAPTFADQAGTRTALGLAASASTDTTNATNISSGTLADGRLSSNVPLKNGTNSFTATNTFATVAATCTRVTGAATYVSGAGLESAYTGSIGYILAYDRSASAGKPLSINGFGGAILLGGTSDNGVDKVQVNGSLQASGVIKIGSGNAPASSSSSGVAGSIAWDANYLYVCVATNSWKRVALTTF